ncbi:O-antigen ligase family protein [Sphingobium amiense]|nr:O-antigen ligase family protein [Sphingobium amiense]
MSGGLSKALTGGNSSVAERMDGDVAVGVVALCIPAYLYSFWAIYKSPFVYFERLKRSAPLWIPIALCVFSVTWSIAPDATIRRTSLLLICGLFSVGLSARLGRDGLIRAVGFVTAFVVTISLISAVVVPDLGMPHDKFYPAIPGLFTQKNNAGRVLLVGVIAGLALMKSRPTYLAWFILAMSVIGVTASFSGTAIGAMVICFLAYYILVSLRGAGLLYLGGIAGFIGAVIIILAFGATFATDDDVFAAFGKDSTLSGRTKIWSAVWRALGSGDHWWLGFGYEAFFASPKGVGSVNWNMYDYIPPHAHNGMMQTWLNIGAIGVCVTAVAMIYIFVRAGRIFASGADRRSAFDFIFLLYFLLINVTEQTTLAYNNFIWSIFFAVAALPPAARAPLAIAGRPSFRSSGGDGIPARPSAPEDDHFAALRSD